MSLTRAVVFANGDYTSLSAQHINISSADYLVCVDGGVRHCLSEGLQPQLLVGDLDSLDKASSDSLAQFNVERLQFPSEKDASDLELALLTLDERAVSEVVVLGASGGRTDHHLFNWQLFGGHHWSFQLRVVDGSVDARLVDLAHPLSVPAVRGQTFSVIPVAGNATGVTVAGAKYPLNNATLIPGSTIGLSNVVSADRLQVSVESGIVLAMFVHLL